MAEEKGKTPEMTMEERLQKDLAAISKLRLFDDVFMRVCLMGNIRCTEKILRTILDKEDLTVIEVSTQLDLSRLVNRSLQLDVLATDSSRRKYNIEIQRFSDGANPYRARYHCSLVDVALSHRGQEFKDLPETYIIFITEKDVVGRGRAVYTVERYFTDNAEPFKDGTHIVYANGAYQGEDQIGRLMHDFGCRNPEEMYSEELSAAAGYYKYTEEGKKIMCAVMEELVAEREADARREGHREGRQEGRREGRQEVQQEMIRSMSQSGVPVEKIAQYARLSVEEVRKMQLS